MRFRTTYILFGLLAIMFGTLAIALYVGPEAEATNWVFPNLHDPANPVDAGVVDKVVIEHERPFKEDPIELTRDAADNWKVKSGQGAAFRADRSAAKGLVLSVFALQKEKTDKPSSLKDWGLEPPASVVTLYKGGEVVAKLNIGAIPEGGGSGAVAYVQNADRPKEPMAVPKTAIEKALLGVNSFRDRTLLGSSAGFQSVRLTEMAKKDEKDRTILLSKDKGQWRFEEPFQRAAESAGALAPTPAGGTPSSVNGLLSDLQSLQVESADPADKDFEADHVAESDMKNYGLDPASPTLHIEIKREEKGAAPVTLVVGLTKKLTDERKTEKYFVRIKGEQSIYRVPVERITPLQRLLADPDKLCDRTLVRLDRQPDAIRLRNKSNTAELEFYRPDAFGAEWKLYLGAAAQKADATKITQLLGLIKKQGLIDTFEDDSIGQVGGPFAPFVSPELRKLGREAALSAHGLTDSTAVAVASLWVDGLDKEVKKDEKKDDDKKPGEKVPEKKEEDKKPTLKKDVENKPTVKLIIGNKDGGDIWVRRITADGGDSILRVREVLLEGEKDQLTGEPIIPGLGAAALLFRSKDLPHFSEMGPHGDPTVNVVKVKLVKDGKTFEVIRDEKKDAKPDAKFEDKYANTWKLLGKDDKDRRPANADTVQSILMALNGLNAAELKAEVTEPSDPNMMDSAYGIKLPPKFQPDLQAIVTVLGKDGKEKKDWQYDFGKDTGAGATTRYAKTSESPLVFTVPKRNLTALANAELRDPTVLNFDVRDARNVSIKGWGLQTGRMTTLVLVSDDGVNWKVTEPTGFTLDTENWHSFLVGLSRLRAVGFVERKPNEKYEFDPKGENLEIRITLKDTKEPIVLWVGKPNEGAKPEDAKGNYATISTTPNELFLVPTPLFDRGGSGPRLKLPFFGTYRE